MKPRKIPMRSCVVTREKLPKQELLRIVKNNEGIVIVDISGKANGRGAYIKKDISIIDKLKKSNALTRHLECEIEESVYEEIKRAIEE